MAEPETPAFTERAVHLVVIVNHTVGAANPEFTNSDAKDAAFTRITEALEAHGINDVSLLSAEVTDTDTWNT